jgi:hypothetical protein
LPDDDIEVRVRDNFGEFGELAMVKAFPKRCATCSPRVLAQNDSDARASAPQSNCVCDVHEPGKCRVC